MPIHDACLRKAPVEVVRFLFDNGTDLGAREKVSAVISLNNPKSLPFAVLS
jgi:hypothetical protein